MAIYSYPVRPSSGQKNETTRQTATPNAECPFNLQEGLIRLVDPESAVDRSLADRVVEENNAADSIPIQLLDNVR